MIDLRPVLVIDGFLLLVLAAAMAVPLLVDLAGQGTEWQAFAVAAMITGFIGLALIFANRAARPRDLKVREAFLLTVGSWLLAAIFAALPFAMGSRGLSGVDAFFETVSGLTTTGATVLTGLDHTPDAILLWRALLQWLGGLAFVIFAIALFPMLHIGGMQIFRMESSGKAEKVKPRVSQVVWSILGAYCLMTAVLGLALSFTEMNTLEAVCHAMSALSTGGFSTSDQSLGHFGEAARWLCVLGMLLGGATFTRYIALAKRPGILEDSQIRWYLTTIGLFALAMTFWNWAVRDMDVYDAFSQSSFNVVSVLTTTGFHSADYGHWGGFAQVAFFVMTFIGGCTGSAASGVKVFRHQVLLAVTGVHVRRLLLPHGVFTIEMNRLNVTEGVVRSVLGFMMLYLFCFALLAVALTMTGLDLLTGLSAAASALANIGPGLGSIIGPGGSYQNLPEVAKWLLAFGMLLGRLELATVLVLFSRSFWRE